MRRAQLAGAARRMQRVRQEKQAFGGAGIGRGQHAGLPSAVRVAAEKHAACDNLAQKRRRLPQAFPIGGRAAGRWRAARTRLPVRQIAAEHGESGFRKFPGHSHKQRRLAVRPGAMRQRDGMAGRALRTM